MSTNTTLLLLLLLLLLPLLPLLLPLLLLLPLPPPRPLLLLLLRRYLLLPCGVFRKEIRDENKRNPRENGPRLRNMKATRWMTLRARPHRCDPWVPRRG